MSGTTTDRYADSIARDLRAQGHDSAADHVVSLADGVDMHMRRVRALEDGIREHRDKHRALGEFCSLCDRLLGDGDDTEGE